MYPVLFDLHSLRKGRRQLTRSPFYQSKMRKNSVTKITPEEGPAKDPLPAYCAVCSLQMVNLRLFVSATAGQISH